MASWIKLTVPAFDQPANTVVRVDSAEQAVQLLNAGLASPVADPGGTPPAVPAANPGGVFATDAELLDPASVLGAGLRAAFVSLGQLAASPDLLAVGTITRTATGAATSFGVAWPDGATGTFTGTESASTPGAIDSYTVTHVANGVTVTYAQPPLTRDSNGAVTARPAMTVA